MPTPSDGVWYRTVTMRTYDGVVEGPGWYHWSYDKAGSVEQHTGPFATEDEARASHAKVKP